MVINTNTEDRVRGVKRIGIYAGTFDPVHAGHISFALQALDAAGLDEVYFLPERRPRNKYGVEHFGHRVAMLNRACRPHTKLKVLELEDVCFSVKQTLPRLRKRFPSAQLVLLAGSDVAQQLTYWPGAEQLLVSCELAIGVRAGHQSSAVRQLVSAWPRPPMALHVIDSFAAEVSSATIREALRKRQAVRGLLPSVARYSDRHWLYVSLA